LVKGTEGDYSPIDCIGDFNANPGAGWDVCGVAEGTKDATLLRKTSVIAGNAGDWAKSAGTNADDCEWVVETVNTVEFAGEHATDQAPSTTAAPPSATLTPGTDVDQRFFPGNTPACYKENGQTIVQYDSSIHTSFHCDDDCVCTDEHPFLAAEGCMSIGGTDGNVHNHAFALSAAGTCDVAKKCPARSDDQKSITMAVYTAAGRQWDHVINGWQITDPNDADTAADCEATCESVTECMAWDFVPRLHKENEWQRNDCKLYNQAALDMVEAFGLGHTLDDMISNDYLPFNSENQRGPSGVCNTYWETRNAREDQSTPDATCSTGALNADGDYCCLAECAGQCQTQSPSNCNYATAPNAVGIGFLCCQNVERSCDDHGPPCQITN
jgi:hypothetical protein